MLLMTGNSRGAMLGDARKVGKNLFYTIKRYKELDLIDKGLTLKQCIAIAYKVEETKKPFEYLNYKIEYQDWSFLDDTVNESF